MSDQPIQPGAQQGVSTPQEVHAATLADPGIPAIQAEVMQEVGPQPTETVPILLGTGITINVPMQSKWRRSAQEFLRMGDFDSWAESVLTTADLDAWDEWNDTDPEMGEINAIFEAVGKATGKAAGGNRAWRRAQDRMPKR